MIVEVKQVGFVLDIHIHENVEIPFEKVEEDASKDDSIQIEESKEQTPSEGEKEHIIQSSSGDEHDIDEEEIMNQKRFSFRISDSKI